MTHFDLSQRFSTASSMVLIVLMQIDGDEVLKTVVLAALGGLSSYLITLVLKILMRYLRKKF